MNAHASHAVPAMPPSRVFNAYLQETRSEILRYLRNPGFMLPMLAFSTVFYAMFGIVLNHGNAGAERYLLASYATFGVIGPALFGFGVGLAMEREKGWLELKRVSPMPIFVYFAAKISMSLLVGFIVLCLLSVAAVGFGDVRITPLAWLALVATLMLGTLPFCALGLWLGTLVKGQAAVAVVNLVYLPMSFLSGLWLPLSVLPKILAAIAPIWPSTHLNALMQAAAGTRHATVLPHLLALAGFAAGFALLAARRLRRHG